MCRRARAIASISIALTCTPHSPASVRSFRHAPKPCREVSEEIEPRGFISRKGRLCTQFSFVSHHDWWTVSMPLSCIYESRMFRVVMTETVQPEGFHSEAAELNYVQKRLAIRPSALSKSLAGEVRLLRRRCTVSRVLETRSGDGITQPVRKSRIAAGN